ncbi:MAG: PGPGW domain-containing protein [Pseudomonadota bacterium]
MAGDPPRIALSTLPVTTPMPDVFAAADALYRNALDIWWVLPLSIAVMIGSTVLLPWLIIQMPPDYFVKGHRHPLARRERHWALHVALVLGKNALGFVMVLAGVAMLALPGQGVLTILAGLMVMDFPGKYHLEGAIIRRPAVLKGLNWIRRRAHKPPLIPPPRHPWRDEHE